MKACFAFVFHITEPHHCYNSNNFSAPRQTSCPIAPASGQHFPFLPAVSSIPVTYADSNFGSCVTLSATRPRAHSKRKTPSPTKMTSSNVEPVKTAAREIDAHLIRENLVTGAVNVASSAINTAKSVLHMIVPQKEDEVNKNFYGLFDKNLTSM